MHINPPKELASADSSCFLYYSEEEAYIDETVFPNHHQSGARRSAAFWGLDRSSEVVSTTNMCGEIEQPYQGRMDGRINRGFQTESVLSDNSQRFNSSLCLPVTVVSLGMFITPQCFIVYGPQIPKLTIHESCNFHNFACNRDNSTLKRCSRSYTYSSSFFIGGTATSNVKRNRPKK